MLKIKDNIDLKELEKFGFEEQMANVYYKLEKNDDSRFESGIIINPYYGDLGETREIVYYTNSTENDIQLETDDLDMTSTIDTLYDLIKADMVEKVDN